MLFLGLRGFFRRGKAEIRQRALDVFVPEAPFVRVAGFFLKFSLQADRLGIGFEFHIAVVEEVVFTAAEIEAGQFFAGSQLFCEDAPGVLIGIKISLLPACVVHGVAAAQIGRIFRIDWKGFVIKI